MIQAQLQLLKYKEGNQMATYAKHEITAALNDIFKQMGVDTKAAAPEDALAAFSKAMEKGDVAFGGGGNVSVTDDNNGNLTIKGVKVIVK